MREALKMMSNAQEDPANFIPADVAKKYFIKEEDVMAIIKHFSLFMLSTPKKGKAESKLVRMSEFFKGDKTMLDQVMDRKNQAEFTQYMEGYYAHTRWLRWQDQMNKEDKQFEEKEKQRLAAKSEPGIPETKKPETDNKNPQ